MKKYKVLIISFLVCLPFWWGANILASNLEDFWYLKKITQNSKLLNARAGFVTDELIFKKIKRQKEREIDLTNLNINAESAIVAKITPNYQTKILFKKNADKIRPIASLTKLMTALVVFDLDETYNLSRKIPITQNAVDQEGDSKFENLKVGAKIPIGNLVYKMLIESSNDAAFAVTQPMGERAFSELMNIYAKEIGLNNTRFFNSTGLEPNESKNTSTAFDLVKIAKHILQNYPQIFGITANRKFSAQNTNKLLEDYPQIIGGKTGWTPSANGCLLLVTQNSKEKDYYISIILGADDRFAEMRKILDVLYQ